MDDHAARLAAASEWGAEQTMSDMEALMWRSEASPRLRSSERGPTPPRVPSVTARSV